VVVPSAVRVLVSSGVVMRGRLVMLMPVVGSDRFFVVLAVLGQLSFGLDARLRPRALHRDRKRSPRREKHYK
jgi:hypothetical protein